MKNKFFLGLVTALVLGTLVNIILGYLKFGYLNKLKNFLEAKKVAEKKPIDKDVKTCQQLVPFASNFGNLKVTILGNGQPVENLEVDLSDKPGPNRCMVKTDKDGVALFSKVPVGKMAIFFNSGSFPKELGKDPTVYVDIINNQTLEKILELPYKQ